jgi:hypothetical protein
MCKKIFFPAIFLFFYAVTSAQNYVTLYEDCNYSGKKHYLEAGTYSLFQMKIDNDKLSCLQIPAGMKVTIYTDDNFKGRSKTYFNSISCLEGEWNDKASSIVVENQNIRPNYNQNDYVIFYNDCYGKGYSQSLGPGRYRGYELGSLKYNISSFAIYGNLRVRTYINNESLSGYSFTHDAGENCLGSSENDKIGSLIIEYKPNQPIQPNYPMVGSGDYVTIYTDCSYRGNSLRLATGSYRGDQLGLLKYDISAIEIPSSLKAKVFINNEYMGGTYYTLSENISCMNSTMNNRIGSITIEETYGNNNNNNNNQYQNNPNERVVIFTDGNYKGQSVSLLPGTYSTMGQVGFPDNALSSLTVPVGYRVVLYEFENFAGKSYTITASKPGFIISGWNDKTSSIAVYRDR